MTFNEKLVKLRKLKGITQDEFASAVGVSRQSVYKWESGQSYPEVMKLVEIKKLFDISIDDLLDDNFEVVLPEKKKRISKRDRERIEREVEIEEGIAPAVTETVEAAPVAEETVAEAPVVEAPVEEASVEAAPAEEEQKEEPKKKGFFARLFGW